MKNPIGRLTFFLLVNFWLSGVAWAAEKDYPRADQASPEAYRVLLENDQVLVLEMRLKPGQSDAMHRHMDETVYFSTGGQIRITLPDGSSTLATPPDGHVMWHPAWIHQVTNVGDTEVVAIIVESKTAAAPPLDT